ncbi:hypothetical protein [Vibrio echinoideorum]|uniref:hypothetical protein n=1 Tax=Vibrio echinoideorum TaxID=2100116 RepID=UPI0035513923
MSWLNIIKPGAQLGVMALKLLADGLSKSTQQGAQEEAVYTGPIKWDVYNDNLYVTNQSRDRDAVISFTYSGSDERGQFSNQEETMVLGPAAQQGNMQGLVANYSDLGGTFISYDSQSISRNNMYAEGDGFIKKWFKSMVANLPVDSSFKFKNGSSFIYQVEDVPAPGGGTRGFVA